MTAAILMAQTHSSTNYPAIQFSQPGHQIKRGGNSVYKSALDSGATTNCFPATFRGTDYQPATTDTAVLAQVANDKIIVSTATDQLNEPALPSIVRDTNLFKEVSIPLLSVNKICAGDLAVLFYGTEAAVFKPSVKSIKIDGTPILLGALDKHTELYMVDVHGGTNTPCKIQGGNTLNAAPATSKAMPKTTINTTTTFHRANSITIKTVPALINYYHMTMGAPPVNTWIKAIDNGWFTSFPGLSSTRVRQYCTNKIETAKGHLKLQRQHVQSTNNIATKRRSNVHNVSIHCTELKKTW